MNKRLITRLEVQKVSSDYFLIYHKDERSGNVFKFGWTNTNGAKENPRAEGMKVGDDEQRQTKDYLTHLVAREGILPHLAANLFNQIDDFCVELRTSGRKYGFLPVYYEDVNR